MKNYVILKKYCEKIFLVGPGNFWFEENNTIGNDESWFYRAYSFALLFMYIMMTIFEIIAIFIGDFPDDEARDCTTFAVSHTIVLTKITSLILRKKFIKNLNRRMILACENYEDPILMDRKYKIMKINVIVYTFIVYGSVFFFIFEGFRKWINGSYFVTIITFYPSYEDHSLLAVFVRFFTTLILCMMMLTMIVSVDSFTMVYLIMIKYKFITLRQYFENLREEVEKLNNNGNEMLAREKLGEGLAEGIKMHSEVLRLSKDIDESFGIVIALQLCLSSGSAVTLLLQLALSDNLTFVTAMKVVFFVFALFFLLGLFLCNAGEITYQASLLSDAIFYCGWHTCPARHGRYNIRKMVHFSIVQAQQPLVMKAFKMIELTYGTFLTVVRGTYSVFALIYSTQQE